MSGEVRGFMTRDEIAPFVGKYVRIRRQIRRNGDVTPTTHTGVLAWLAAEPTDTGILAGALRALKADDTHGGFDCACILSIEPFGESA